MLSLSVEAHRALSLADMNEIGLRAVNLHCHVIVRRAGDAWTVSAISWAHDWRVKHENRRGHLADLIYEALDVYERKYIWTALELAQVARQSGVVVVE